MALRGPILGLFPSRVPNAPPGPREPHQCLATVRPTMPPKPANSRSLRTIPQSQAPKPEHQTGPAGRPRAAGPRTPKPAIPDPYWFIPYLPGVLLASRFTTYLDLTLYFTSSRFRSAMEPDSLRPPDPIQSNSASAVPSTSHNCATSSSSSNTSLVLPSPGHGLERQIANHGAFICRSDRKLTTLAALALALRQRLAEVFIFQILFYITI